MVKKRRFQETWYTTTKQYNFPEPPFKYTEEDNSVDETDLESTSHKLDKEMNVEIDYNKIVDEISKRMTIKIVKVENDGSDIYLYIYLCFVVVVFLIITAFLALRYMP